MLHRIITNSLKLDYQGVVLINSLPMLTAYFAVHFHTYPEPISLLTYDPLLTHTIRLISAIILYQILDYKFTSFNAWMTLHLLEYNLPSNYEWSDHQHWLFHFKIWSLICFIEHRIMELDDKASRNACCISDFVPYAENVLKKIWNVEYGTTIADSFI